MTLSFVGVNVKVTGFHKWTTAPDKVAFLRDLHRHTFTIRVKLKVSNMDREVEFTLLKKDIQQYLQDYYTPGYDGYNFGPRSCEMLADEMWTYLLSQGYTPMLVSFSEDEEFEGGIQCYPEK